MTHRTAQRFAAAAALVAVLFVGAAAPAQARDLGPTHAWQRLQGLWTRAVSVLLSWSGSLAPDGRHSGGLVKEGPAVDPDGKPSPAPPAGNSGDQGHATDPDG